MASPFALLAAAVAALTAPITVSGGPSDTPPAGHAPSGDIQPRNAAAAYRAAMQRLGILDPGDGTAAQPRFTGEERQTIADVTGPEGVTLAVRNALGRVAAELDAARAAAASPECDFGLDRSKGFGFLMPHVAPMREIARLLRADVAMRIADGDMDGAVASMAALGGLTRHVASDHLLITSLVGSAVGSAADASIAMAIDRGMLDAEQSKKLLDSLQPIAGTDPFQYVTALEGEREMIDTSVRGALEGDGSLQGLAEELGLDATPLVDLGKDELLDQLSATDRLLQRAGDAFRETDPEQASAILDEVESAVADGAAGRLGQVLLPSFRGAFDAKRRSEAMLASRMAQLRDLASGAKSPAQLANAAPWYLAAARAAEAMQGDDQRLVELVRGGGSLEAPFDALVRAAVERHHGHVIAPLIAGAQAGRCEMVRDRARAVGLVALPPYSSGLRGAVRTLLASALLACRDAVKEKEAGAEPGAAGGASPPTAVSPASDTRSPSGNTGAPSPAVAAPTPASTTPPPLSKAEAAAEALCTALRVVEHVSSDPAMCHAAIAQSILAETSEALTSVLASGVLAPAQVDSIRESVERLNRVDPLGHRRGLMADREAVLMRAPGFRDDAIRKARRKLLERIDAGTLLACGVAKSIHERPWSTPTPQTPHGLPDERPYDCGARDLDLLLDLSDLYQQESCTAVAARWKEIAAAPVFASGDLELLSKGPPLPGEPLPIVVDMVRLAAEAPALVAALDELLRAATKK